MGMKHEDRTEGDTRGYFGLSFPWVIALVGALLLTVSSANFYTFGVFFKPIAGDLGWSRAELSGSIALRSLIMAALAAPMGAMSERYGPRRVTCGCLALIGAAYLLFSRITTLWELYLVQGLLMGVAQSGPFVVLTSAVGKWHERRRGLALGIVALGGGLASIIFPPLAGSIIQSADWRAAMVVMGLIVLVVGVPFSLVLKVPHAPPASGVQPGARHSGRAGFFAVWTEFPRFLKDRAFATMALMFFLFAAATNVVTAHFVNYATDSGVAALTAAAMMSASGVASIAGRLSIGAVSDKTGVKTAVVLCLALLTGGLVLMDWNASMWMLWLSVVMFGFGMGGEWPLVPALVGATFGTQRLATITGMVMATTFAGAAMGPYLAGVMFDMASSYFWALALSAAFVAVALVLSLRLRSGRQSLPSPSMGEG